MKLHLFVALSFLSTGLLAQESSLEKMLRGKDVIVDQVLNHQKDFELQLIYTKITRDEKQQPIFEERKIGIDENYYFYPASTVKLPVAILALERLHELEIVGLNRNSKMISGKGRPVQTPQTIDFSAKDSIPSLEQYIKKIFLYSDNDAYNRLYEFLGPRYINEKLTKKGINDTRIIHRVGAPGFNAEENRHLNPVSFYQEDSLLFHQAARYSSHISNLSLTEELKGKGFMKSGMLVEEKMNFSQKNFISLPNLLAVLKRVLFPSVFSPEERFLLTNEEHNFLLKSMATYPSESEYPKIDQPDGYVKFFLLGGSAKKIPSGLRIFNKVGDAYGYLIDVAYIVDLKNNIEFMLAGVIHVNQNKIYNDDHYEYESIGFPFFKSVGQIIYEHELNNSNSNGYDPNYLQKLFNN